jgi:2'-5' RNA ligase
MERVREYAMDAKWARVEGLHVTLKFLGEVRDEKLSGIKAALAGVKSAKFEVAFAGIGFFPNPKSPRVFWAGVKAGAELPQLAKSVDDALRPIGFQPEDKPYHPHLTLARARDKELRALTPLLEREAAPQFGTMTSREFFLFQSQTGRGGSKYTKLETFRLE